MTGKERKEGQERNASKGKEHKRKERTSKREWKGKATKRRNQTMISKMESLLPINLREVEIRNPTGWNI